MKNLTANLSTSNQRPFLKSFFFEEKLISLKERRRIKFLIFAINKIGRRAAWFIRNSDGTEVSRDFRVLNNKHSSSLLKSVC